MSTAFEQTFSIPPPKLTEKNCPDQSGKVHLVTGGYTGIGKELVKILYQHNAIVYVAGRNESKAAVAISTIKGIYPASRGRLEFLEIDLSDLKTVKPAVAKFLAQEKSLHVLTLNAGVMFVPRNIKSTQGYDMQMATNCLGPHLFYSLLRPVLLSTAKGAPPASVRVTWAGSIGIDGLSPRPGGMRFINGTGEPVAGIDEKTMYGQTKTGNLMLANVHGRRDASSGVLHVCWNPGNLRTELTRHTGFFTKLVFHFIMNPPIYGAYTELYAALSADLTMDHRGSYIAPWGRIGAVRKDIASNCAPISEGGDGGADKFVAWCEDVTTEFSRE